MSQLTIILGGITLPEQIELLETPTPNAVDVRTLNGDLYTDFINYYRSWIVAFDAMLATEWSQIMALYKSQFENETYLTFECDALGINTVVKLDIGSTYWQWSGTQVGDGTQGNYPTLTLLEQGAIS